jgi:hypothetical protein
MPKRLPLPFVIASAALVAAVAAVAVAAIALATQPSEAATADRAPVAAQPQAARSLGGAFSFEITDTGAVVKWAGGSLQLTPGGLTLSAPVITIAGTSRVDVNGALVRLNGCKPVARVGDRVSTTGVVLTGSPTVCAGG